MKRPENYHKELAEEYEKSGMTMLAFCKEKGITYGALHYAIGKGKKGQTEGAFVKVETADTVTFLVGRNRTSVTMGIHDLIGILGRLL